MFLKNKSLSFKIGLVFAILHLWLFMATFYDEVTLTNEQAGMGLVYFGLVDIILLPIWFLISTITHLINSSSRFLNAFFPALIAYGILGTIWWFFIPIGIARIVKRIVRKFISSK